jgi:hypothetical protein
VCVVDARCVARYADAGASVASVAGAQRLGEAVERVARGALELLEALQRESETEQRQKRAKLLALVQREENAVVNGVKYIVELAHVIGEQKKKDSLFFCFGEYFLNQTRRNVSLFTLELIT